MWASPEGNNNRNRVSTASHSKSSSTCSSPSPTVPNSSSRKSMEEVWEEINLGSLQDHPNITTTNRTNHSVFPGMILQDFLARPFNRDPTPPTTRVASMEHCSDTPTSFFNYLGPSPPTMLSLNSGSDFQCPEASVSMWQKQKQKPNRNHPQLHTHTSSGSPSSFDASTVPCVCSKRPQDTDENSGDRRHKRMIKNRESAARSRARKQESLFSAYTYELEIEVARLQAENARLRTQQQELLAASAQLPKKNTLCRTSTAPF